VKYSTFFPIRKSDDHRSYTVLVSKLVHLVNSNTITINCLCLVPNANMPSIPIDIIPSILNHVNKADLLTICFVNKDYCSFSQDVLYRDIRIYERRKGTQVCQTLAQFTHLARRVRSFYLTSNPALGKLCYTPEFWTSFQNMIFLRSLSLYSFTNGFSFLDGCTFKLVSFTCKHFDFEPLHQFLLSQPSLTDVGLGLFMGSDDSLEFGATFLPNVTRITTRLSWLAQIIPDRPVNEVNCIGCVHGVDSVDMTFFTRSAAPIQKVSIDYTYLYQKSGQFLASIFTSLTHLNIYVCQPTWFRDIVRGLDFLRI
jgi:hypothetical protein